MLQSLPAPALILLAVLALAALALLGLWRRAAGTAALREAALAEAQARAEAAARQAAEAGAAREAEARRAAVAETRAEALEALLAERTAERDRTREDLAGAERRTADLARALAEARLAAAKDAEAAARELATLRELRQEMTDQFRLLADETLKRTGTDFQARHAEQLSALLTPFREQVSAFRTELQTREQQAGLERARFGEQLRLLHERTAQLGAEAVALTRALKGEKQKQGAWGEMILNRLLEESGLEAGVHFVVQGAQRGEDGRLWRPDVIVRLPQKKVLVVDSKVSLNDYVEASSCDDPEARAAAIRRHVAAIRRHVQTLADKGYQTLDEGSVDYVMMFVPVEGAYAEAVRADDRLVAWAMEQRVAVMTPATLMLALRIVDHIWTVERRESNAAAIADRAGRLYDKVAGFCDTMAEVGGALERAQTAHRKAMGQLSEGSGNVLGQVDKLRRLGARNQKQIAVAFEPEDEAAALPAGE